MIFNWWIFEEYGYKLNLIRDMKMKINLSSLKKTIQSLENSFSVYDRYEETKDENLKISLKESVIQSFEVSYEVSRKIMMRYFKEYGSEDIDQMTIQDIFRLAHKNGIISGAQKWLEYRKNRNATSHTYDVDVAEQVFIVARKFLDDVRFLYGKLEEKIES